MVLVTGGTGFLGSGLLPKLTKAGHKVRCLVRSQANAEVLRSTGVEVALGDVTIRESLRKPIDGVDIVIHLVAVIREENGTFFEINVKGTRNMVEVARESGVSQFVYMSALGAGRNSRYRYTYSKWQAEEIVRASNLKWIIFRPSVMFGRGSGFIDRMLRSSTLIPFIAPIPGSGKTRFQPVWVEDVTSCVLQSLGRKLPGQTYENLSYEETLDIILCALEIKRAKIHIPMSLMKQAVKILEKFMSNPLVTSAELAQLDLDNITDLDSVERCFGFKPLAFSNALNEWRPLSVHGRGK
jgi:NADH dehydrogenase